MFRAAFLWNHIGLFGSKQSDRLLPLPQGLPSVASLSLTPFAEHGATGRWEADWRNSRYLCRWEDGNPAPIGDMSAKVDGGYTGDWR